MSWLIYLFFQLFICYSFSKYSEDECQRNIFERCNHQSEFTKQEIENARKWLQNHIYNKYQGDIKPQKAACKRLIVRKDFKCLTKYERWQFMDVSKKLYDQGIMDKFTDIHVRYWPPVHKTIQLGPWHRWFINELEKEMRKINPEITLPYYGAQIDFSRPEKSIVWKYLGTTGNHYNGWCVREGLYKYINTTRCMKRQWNKYGTLPVTDGPEIYSIMNQLSLHVTLSNFFDSGLHFVDHLAWGGYYGDMSVDTAPMDLIFFLWHNYVMDIHNLKYELQDSYRPKDYNALYRIDQATGILSGARIESDRLLYYTNVTVLETYQVGFGDLCSITDQMVIAINQKIRNVSVVPLAVKRMPLSIKAKYFPKFLSGHIDPFTHMFEDVGDCNKKCRPIPMFQPYVSTENGRRQVRRYVYDEDLNISPIMLLSQAYFSIVIKDLNKSGYCSPYVL